jgi:hypothetical protein
MAEYGVQQDKGYYTKIEGLNEAIRIAEELLGELPAGDESTFTVEDESGYLLASVTNRHIVGSFNKQQWGGHKGDDAIYIGEESFDATAAILLLEHKDLVCMKDQSESTDDIGREHIDWSGPCYVHIEDSICAYFGVDDLQEITPEALSFARQRANPQPAEEQVVMLSVKLSLRVTSGASVSDFIENLDYSVISNTAGVTVRDTEIVGSD